MIHTTTKIDKDSGMRKKQETPQLVSFGYGHTLMDLGTVSTHEYNPGRKQEFHVTKRGQVDRTQAQLNE